MTANGGSWPAATVQRRARKLTFDSWVWQAEVSCQGSPGTRTAGQRQSMTSVCFGCTRCDTGRTLLRSPSVGFALTTAIRLLAGCTGLQIPFLFVV